MTKTDAQIMFCDRHPLQKMDRIQLTTKRDSSLKQDPTDGFKCRQCTRVYILAGDSGYADYVIGSGEIIPNLLPQLRCPEHKSPFYLAAFQDVGDESVRTWRCGHPRCEEEQTTIGENYSIPTLMNQ
jgi:hypothetical protein